MVRYVKMNHQCEDNNFEDIVGLWDRIELFNRQSCIGFEGCIGFKKTHREDDTLVTIYILHMFFFE